MKEKEEENEGVKKKKNNIMKGIIITICSLAVIYIFISCYFISHFHIGTKINGVDISGKTVTKANEEIKNKIQNYELKIVGRNNLEDVIKAEELDISYNGEDKIERIKDNQNSFSWLLNIFSENDNYVDDLINYNSDKLNQVTESLLCFKDENIIEPKNASFEYSVDGYKIIDEDEGCKVDKVLLLDLLIQSIEEMNENIDLEKKKCYSVPKYRASDEKVIKTKDELDKYVKAKINYTAGATSEALDGNITHKWFNVNEDMEVIFDTSKVSEYLKNLGDKFNTVGTARNFKTSSGSQISISGGSYGWIVNEDEEEISIISTIKSGETVTREPIYSQTALTHDADDIGNTYVEVSLGGQHLWFYKNGQLITEGAVVTGNTSNGHATPPGVYFLEYKESNAILRGDDYECPVSYWLPFNNGIGMHDATWRGSFGGSIYTYDGSHGCVNCPYNLAETIFSNIEAGTPVVCY